MGLLGDIKEVIEIAQKADNIELYGKVLDLQAKALEEQEEKQELRERIRELERRLDVTDRLTPRQNGYVLSKDDGSEDGPFCTVCWDQRRKLARLHNVNAKGQGDCPGCGTATYYDTPAAIAFVNAPDTGSDW